MQHSQKKDYSSPKSPAARPSIRSGSQILPRGVHQQGEKGGAEKGFKVRPMRKADPPPGPPFGLVCFLEGKLACITFAWVVSCELSTMRVSKQGKPRCILGKSNRPHSHPPSKSVTEPTLVTRSQRSHTLKPPIPSWISMWWHPQTFTPYFLSHS